MRYLQTLAVLTTLTLPSCTYTPQELTTTYCEMYDQNRRTQFLPRVPDTQLDTCIAQHRNFTLCLEQTYDVKIVCAPGFIHQFHSAPP